TRTAITIRFLLHALLSADATPLEARDEAPEFPVLPSLWLRIRSQPCAWWSGVRAHSPRAVDGSAERLRKTWSDGTPGAAPHSTPFTSLRLESFRTTSILLILRRE